MTEPDDFASRAALQVDPLATLSDPRVRSYLLGVLTTDLPPEAKYQRFIDLFQRERQIREHALPRISEVTDRGGSDVLANVEKVLAAVMEELRVWQPNRIVAEVRDSIRSALGWLTRTQNTDGGWTIIGELQSGFWETAFSAMCLSAAGRLDRIEFNHAGIQPSLTRAVGWLNSHMEGWYYEYPRHELLPVYNVALAVVSYHELGPENFGTSFASGVSHGIERLVSSRCPDGGWRARGWGVSSANAIRSAASEAGATSFGLRALSAGAAGAHREAIEEATACLLSLRNGEGAWNGFDGQPSVTKTCDGVLGLLAASRAGVSLSQIEPAIDTAVAWIQSRETPVLRDGVIEGWGWDYVPIEIGANIFRQYIMQRVGAQDSEFLSGVYTYDETVGKYRLSDRLRKEETNRVIQLLAQCGYAYDFMGTCLTVEALVNLRKPALPALVSNCKWLIENQCRIDASGENGSWVTNTARITGALIGYYRYLQTFLAGAAQQPERPQP